MKEKVLIALVDFKEKTAWSIKELLYEMDELVKACDAEPVGHIICPAHPPSAATLIHKGKVEEVALLAETLGAKAVVVSTELKGHQQRELEEAFKIKTIDRTQLILDIFARRATTLEGKLQVELAQLEYRLPRLAGHYDDLSRQGGGIGTMGPGETKLETDRRRIAARIDRIKKDLEDVTRSREVKRKKRENKRLPLISVVGYTNAGKSTLLNAMTGSHQVTKDGLFTTLDSLARQCVLPNKQKVVFSDTVGFIHDLPHRLIEAFKATLEEVQCADLLLHVVDLSNNNYTARKDAVDGVLKELGVLDKPTILVLNKLDALEEDCIIQDAKKRYQEMVVVSALTTAGLDALFYKIESELANLIVTVHLLLPSHRMDLINLAHKEGDVISVEYTDNGILLAAHLPHHLAGKLIQAGELIS
jgi:GTPase